MTFSSQKKETLLVWHPCRRNVALSLMLWWSTSKHKQELLHENLLSFPVGRPDLLVLPREHTEAMTAFLKACSSESYKPWLRRKLTWKTRAGPATPGTWNKAAVTSDCCWYLQVMANCTMSKIWGKRVQLDGKRGKVTITTFVSIDPDPLKLPLNPRTLDSSTT